MIINYYIKNTTNDSVVIFSNLAEIHENKLLNRLIKHVLLSVAQYNHILEQIKQFDSLPTEKGYILKMFGDITTSKAACINRFPETLKNGVDVLAKLVHVFAIF